MTGVPAPLSELLGPLLPALSAGLIAGLVFSVVDAAAGAWAAGAAALVVIALPGFLPLHRTSLDGPPLTAFTLMTVAVMLYAPRFSLAYGLLAAIAAVFVSPAGVGLPLAALGWALYTARVAAKPPWRRLLMATLPLVLAVALARWVGDGWPDDTTLAWHGHLDEGLQAAGRVIGDQLAPTLEQPALRRFAIADLALVLVAVAVMAWRRVWRLAAFEAVAARFHPAVAITAAALTIGLLFRWLLVTPGDLPALAAVFPLVVLAAIAAAGSVGILWRRWPRWGKLLCVVVVLGWLQAALRA